MKGQGKVGAGSGEPVVVFLIDGTRYALPLEVVREVRGADEVPEEVPGVAAHRLLGLAEQAGGRRRALEYADGDTRFLLEVDSVEGVTTIQTDALERVPAYFGGAARELIRGLLTEEEEMLIVLRPEIVRERGMEMLEG